MKTKITFVEPNMAQDKRLREIPDGVFFSYQAGKATRVLCAKVDGQVVTLDDLAYRSAWADTLFPNYREEKVEIVATPVREF